MEITLYTELYYISQLNFSINRQIWNDSKQVESIEPGESISATREIEITGGTGPIIKATGCEMGYRVEIDHSDGSYTENGTQQVC